MGRPTATGLTARAGFRRGGRGLLLLVYLWIAGVFPVLHASAEQPAPLSALHGSEGTQPGGSLPVGHDHLTCHFCSTVGLLVGLPTAQVAALPHVAETLPARQAPFAEGVTLAWTHHALPSRAPPQSLA